MVFYNFELNLLLNFICCSYVDYFFHDPDLHKLVADRNLKVYIRIFSIYIAVLYRSYLGIPLKHFVKWQIVGLG